MIDQKKTSGTPASAGISEAERMAKIRELLVGPVIADESARVDKSVDRLNEFAKEQQETISALQIQLRKLEEDQRVGIRRLHTRLLGMMEALVADEKDVLARLERNEALLSKLENEKESGGG